MQLRKWYKFWKRTSSKKIEELTKENNPVKQRTKDNKLKIRDKKSLVKRKIKKVSALLKNFFFLSLVILLIFGFYFVLTGDFFKVKFISCQKEGFPCKDEIQFFEEFKGRNIFFNHIDQIVSKIKDKILTISEVKIRKKLPDKLFIEIIPRKSYVSLTKDNKVFYLVDDIGFVYQKDFVKPNDQVLIYFDKFSEEIFLGKRIENQEFLQTLRLIADLKNSFISFKHIVLSDLETITIFLEEPIIASFSAKKSTSSQVDSLQFILKQSKIEGKLPAYIDLRFDKPVLKY